MGLDLTKPIVTRGGEKVRIVCTDMRGPKGTTSLLGLIDFTDCESMHTWTMDGEFYGNGQKSDLDLMNPPETRAAYVNIYNHTCTTREEADKAHKMSLCGNRLACVRVEFEEGWLDP